MPSTGHSQFASTMLSWSPTLGQTLHITCIAEYLTLTPDLLVVLQVVVLEQLTVPAGLRGVMLLLLMMMMVMTQTDQQANCQAYRGEQVSWGLNPKPQRSLNLQPSSLLAYPTAAMKCVYANHERCYLVGMHAATCLCSSQTSW